MNRFVLPKKVLEYILKSPELIEAEDVLISVQPTFWKTQNRNTQVTVLSDIKIPSDLFVQYIVQIPTIYKLKAKKLSSAVSDIECTNIRIEILDNSETNQYFFKIINDLNSKDYIEVEYEEVKEDDFLDLQMSYDVSFSVEASEKFYKCLDKLLKVSYKVKINLNENTLELIANNYVSGLHKHQTITVINPHSKTYSTNIDISKSFTKIIKHDHDKNIEFNISDDIINLKTYFSEISSEYFILVSKN